MSKIRLCVATVVAVLLVPLLAALGWTDARADEGFCGLAGEAGLQVFEWDGDAGDSLWATDANWVDNEAPDNGDAAAGYVCIDAANDADETSDTVYLVHADENPGTEPTSAISALVQAIDVQVGTTLSINRGGKLFVYGDQVARPSYVRGTLELTMGYLGGPGLIDVLGDMVWSSGEQSGSTVTSTCEVIDGCAPSVPTVGVDGRMVVTGNLTVQSFQGGNHRGVNLNQGYAVEVADPGRLTIVDTGYIALSRSTRLDVLEGGTLTFDGDGNVFEGTLDGPETLAPVTNEGTVEKIDGDGISSINARYSGDGEIRVDTGTLDIAGGSPAEATVGPGASLGTAGCEKAVTCVPTTSANDPQSAVIAPTGATDTPVSIEEEPGQPEPGDVLPPIAIVAPKRVATITFEYHRGAPGIPEREGISIFYRRPNVKPVKIPRCRPGNVAPRGVTACIAARGESPTGFRFRVRSWDPTGRWSLRPSEIDFVNPTNPLVGAPEGCMVTWPTYPYRTTKTVWLRDPGRFVIRQSAEERTDDSGSNIAQVDRGQEGRNRVTFPIRKSGWVAAVIPGVESSGSFRVQGTTAVRFTRMSKKAFVGSKVWIHGKVTPGGRRKVTLYVKAPGDRFLERRRITTRTKPNGRFAIAFVPGRTRVHKVAVMVDGGRDLTDAMSRRAVKVTVKPRPRVEVKPVTRTVDYVDDTTPVAPPNPPPYPRLADRRVACKYAVK